MRGTQSVVRILHLDPRRGTLSVICIGAPIVVGVLTGQASAGLVGGIAGLLLTLSETEGSLASRLGTTAGVTLGIAVGAALGKWLSEEHAASWIVFFVGIFAAGLLNQVGKGPHFAVRFGAIAFAVIAGPLEPWLLWERLEDTFIAAGLVACVTLLFFPLETIEILRKTEWV